MDLILCHTTANFDTLGAAVGLSRLHPGAQIVLAGGAYAAMRDFLGLHHDEYALLERQSVNPDQIRTIAVVETQTRDQLGLVADWLALPDVAIAVYDHHPDVESDISATKRQVEAVGTTTTLIVEQLQAQAIAPTIAEATVMALGIHINTGSLTLAQTTVRDARALAWLMEQGASLRTIAHYAAVPGAELPSTARALMSSPVRTIRPETSIAEAQRLLLRHSDSGLFIIDAGQLVGVISRRDLDLALHYGFSHAPVKGHMTTNLKTITPETLLPAIAALMVTYDIGRLPVLAQGELVGVVTRTDVLRQLHRGEVQRGRGAEGQRRRGAEARENSLSPTPHPSLLTPHSSLLTPHPSLLTPHSSPLTPHPSLLIPHPSSLIPHPSLLTTLRQCLRPAFWQVLAAAAAEAEQQGWHLYVVGGAVRDLLLAIANGTAQQGGLLLEDIDLVVDGFYRAAAVGAGVALARSLQTVYPTARLEIHGKFQTAALFWHNDSTLKSLWVDFATARTEFYPYPAANPEVEASSIRQDLYRRDFTINAMAIRLTEPHAGERLDFFGGWLDLQAKQIRVLHSNSFIEDPTRIYRAVRFAVRLGFQLEAQTEGYIRYAIASGIYTQIQNRQMQSMQSQVPLPAPALQTRLKAELKYIFQSSYWKPALQKLSDLGALQCLHPTLEMDADLWQQLRLVDRGLKWLKSQHSALSTQHSESTQTVILHPSSLILHPSSLILHPSSFPPSWLALLEVLIASLAPEHRGAVAENLQLPSESVERLQQLETAQRTLMAALPVCQRPSQIVQLLRHYNVWLLALVMVRSGRSSQTAMPLESPRRRIWQHLTHWLTIKPPLDGNDLKALGYKPGPQFKDILDALAAATLDSVVATRAEAEAFVAARMRDEEG